MINRIATAFISFCALDVKFYSKRVIKMSKQFISDLYKTAIRYIQVRLVLREMLVLKVCCSVMTFYFKKVDYYGLERA